MPNNSESEIYDSESEDNSDREGPRILAVEQLLPKEAKAVKRKTHELTLANKVARLRGRNPYVELSMDCLFAKWDSNEDMKEFRNDLMVQMSVQVMLTFKNVLGFLKQFYDKKILPFSSLNSNYFLRSRNHAEKFMEIINNFVVSSNETVRIPKVTLEKQASDQAYITKYIKEQIVPTLIEFRNDINMFTEYTKCEYYFDENFIIQNQIYVNNYFEPLNPIRHKLENQIDGSNVISPTDPTFQKIYNTSTNYNVSEGFQIRIDNNGISTNSVFTTR